MNMLRDIKNRVMLTVARAVLRGVDDGKKMQVVQISILEDEVRDQVERFQNYGFTSVPKPGAEAAVVYVGGNRDHGLVIAVDDRRYRLKGLASGEVALYSDEGDSIVLKRGNTIELTTHTLTVNASTKVELNAPEVDVNASTKVSFTSPLVEMTGELQVLGNISDLYTGVGTTMGSMREIYNSHHHAENDSGGPTEEPNEQM